MASILDLPPDVWHVIARAGLGQTDLGALLLTCRDLAAKVDDVLLERGYHAGHAGRAVKDTRRLTLAGLPRRYGLRAPLPSLQPPRLASLRSLRLHHPHLAKDAPFWSAVFEGCPALRSVTMVSDFLIGNYASDVRHTCDLLRLGVPRLRRLDIEGGWMVMSPTAMYSSQFPEILEAITAMRALPPVPSATLRHLRAACKQVPVGVDAPLQHLHVDDPYDTPCGLPRPANAPYALARMGDVTRRSLEQLVWNAHWPGFDAAVLTTFERLRSLDLSISSTTQPERLSHSLTTLARLPPGLESLVLRLDVCLMRASESDVVWGTPLRHLRRLRELSVHALFAPQTVAELLGDWLGASSEELRLVRAEFQEPASQAYTDELEQLQEQDEACSDDEHVVYLLEEITRSSTEVDTRPLCRWLDAHPRAVAEVRGVRRRIRCTHPRFV